MLAHIIIHHTYYGSTCAHGSLGSHGSLVHMAHMVHMVHTAHTVHLFRHGSHGSHDSLVHMAHMHGSLVHMVDLSTCCNFMVCMTISVYMILHGPHPNTDVHAHQLSTSPKEL